MSNTSSLGNISGLGSAGGVGAGTSGQYKSTATASNSLGKFSGGDTGAGGSAGTRGFINNFAAAGASLNADQGINPPLSAGQFSVTWILLGVGALALILWWVRKHR